MKNYVTQQLYTRKAVGIGMVKALLFFLQLSAEIAYPGSRGGFDFLHLTQLSAEYIDGPECWWPDPNWFHLQQALVMLLPSVVLVVFLLSGAISWLVVRVLGSKMERVWEFVGYVLCCRCCCPADDITTTRTSPLIAGFVPATDYQNLAAQQHGADDTGDNDDDDPFLADDLDATAKIDEARRLFDRSEAAVSSMSSLSAVSNFEGIEADFAPEQPAATRDASTSSHSIGASTPLLTEAKLEAHSKSFAHEQSLRATLPTSPTPGPAVSSNSLTTTWRSTWTAATTNNTGGTIETKASMARTAAKRTWQQCANILLFMSLLVYFQVTLSVFRSLDCNEDPFTREAFVVFSPNEPCTQRGWFLAVIVLGFVTGVIGTPVLWLTLVLANFKTLNDLGTRSWLGVLYGDYHKRFAWWMCVEAAGYTSVALISTYCGNDGCIPFWASIVLMVFLMLHVYCRPHKLPLDDVAWVASYCATLLLLIWGRVSALASYAEIASSATIIGMFLFFILMLLPISKPINVLLKAFSIWVFPEGYGNHQIVQAIKQQRTKRTARSVSAINSTRRSGM